MCRFPTTPRNAAEQQRSRRSRPERCSYIAEIVFTQLAVQVLFLAVLMDTLHSALADTEVAFHGVRINDAPSIFLAGVVHSVVLRELRIAPPSRGGSRPYEGGFRGRRSASRYERPCSYPHDLHERSVLYRPAEQG